MLLWGEKMQIKKEDLKNDIIEAAKVEFLHHGYEGASMRIIASKSHTTTTSYVILITKTIIKAH